MSNLDEQTRLRLLEEIGIDVWLPRSHTPADALAPSHAAVARANPAAAIDAPRRADAGPATNGPNHNADNNANNDAGNSSSHSHSHAPNNPSNNSPGNPRSNIPSDISSHMDELRRAAAEANAPRPITPPKTSEQTVAPTTTRTPQHDASITQMGWPELQQAVDQCTRCPLHASRINPVFGIGNRTADVLVVGETPGADEDLRGEPFVGRTGQLLDLMLLAIGIKRHQVFVANVVKSRPPSNRSPSTEEMAACLPYLRRQVELVQPKLIIAVGDIAIASLLDTNESVDSLRGTLHDYAGVPTVVTYHPAYLLRRPAEKAKAYDDLMLAQRTLNDAE